MSTDAASPQIITNHVARVGDLNIHYLSAGRGEPLVLLHGCPQHSHMWRKAMPLLAERYAVIAPDQRGMGGSSIPAAGYDKRAMAEDIRQLVRQLGFDAVNLVGYDLGGQTAYAWASMYPDEVRRLALLEYAAPGHGYETFAQPVRDWQSWQIAFFTVPDVALQFIMGRERELLAWFFWHWSDNPEAVSRDDFEVYVRQLQKPGALRAMFTYYAEMLFEDMEQTKEFAKQKLSMPVLALGGARGAGDYVLKFMRPLCEDIRGGVIEGAGHWIADEQPAALAGQLLDFFGEEATQKRAITKG